MEPSDSSESNSATLITLFKNPIFDFHLVINALMTPITSPTPTLSLVTDKP